MKKILSIFLSLIITASFLFSGNLYSRAQDEYQYGFDISYHNGDFDFTTVDESINDFVMIRLGYYNHLDTQFWSNVKKAYDLKLNYGVYLYSYAYSSEEAQIEADFVLDTLSELGEYAEYFTLPVAYDLEGDDKSALAMLGKEQITRQMTLFCDCISSAGYTPMVYVNNNWLRNYIDLGTIIKKQYKLWYAYYTSSPDFTKPIEINIDGLSITPDIWQYSSSDNIDKNVMYSPEAMIKPLSCFHSYSATEYPSSCKSNGYILHTCTKCSRQYRVMLDKEPHQYTNACDPTCNICGSKRNTAHKYSETITKPARCTENGVKTLTCSLCGNIKTEDIAPTGHNVVVDKAVAPTYKKAGKTEGKHCKVCGKVIVKQKNVAKKKLKAPSVSSIKAGKKTFTLKWKKVSDAAGYEIQYSTSKSFKSAKTVKVKGAKTTSKTVKKLKKGKTYYVRIKAYRSDAKSSWSKTCKITVK